jgi:signal transduction histidine kinase/DNA-binding response OmpR family regulator
MNESKKNSVLVVDDENSNIMALTHILRPDYTVYASKGGQNAIAAAEKHVPDVILLDIIMPEMDGYAIIAALKESEKTQNIPVIFITCLSSVGDEEKGLSLGAVDYIPKPFSPALVKLRVLNQIKLIEQFRMNEYEIMKYKLANDALNIALWDMDVESADPINPNNKFTWSNEFRQMLGFSDESDFPNMLHSWSGRLHPEDKKKTLDAFAAHINDRTGKTPYDIEYRLMLINGDYRTFRAFGTTLRDNSGVPIRVAGAVMDITERQKLEEARTTSRAKSAFLANMSHEIRTPMNAILGITEILMQNKALPDEHVDGLGRILNSCDMLLGIINDILDFSKIEAGKLDIMPAEYDVANLIIDSIHLNMARVGDKPIEFEVEIDENIPSRLIGDGLRIKQVLNNLLSNAFKYTDAGKITLSVSCNPLYSEYGLSKFISLVLCVRDTGQGMTEEQINKLFDEYSRFNQESGRTIEGTGLGLSITNRLVKLMEGEINVDSKPDKGSLFTIRLPQGMAGNEVLGRELVENLRHFRLNYMTNRKRAQIMCEPMPYGSVLVVDDVEMNLYVAEGLMKSYNLQIDTVKSGFEAIDRIKSGKVYDIIFMDQMMPKMDGIKTTEILRDSGYTNPIVALTANALVGQADIFLQSGFDGFISKPIDVRHLNSILNKFIRDKQPHEVIEAARRQSGGSKGNEKNTADKVYDDFIEAIGKIEEVNAKIGLSLFSGDKRMYRDTLEIFCKTLESQCVDMSSFLEAGNIAGFSISAHAIKSQLATIGAVELSDISLKLETAAKADDAATCENLFPDFQDSLLALYKKITAILPSKAFADRESGDRAILREGVKKALSAAGEYDNDAGIAALESLLVLDFGKDENTLLEAAIKEFREFDCEKAVEILGKVTI